MSEKPQTEWRYKLGGLLWWNPVRDMEPCDIAFEMQAKRPEMHAWLTETLDAWNYEFVEITDAGPYEDGFYPRTTYMELYLCFSDQAQAALYLLYADTFDEGKVRPKGRA